MKGWKTISTYACADQREHDALVESQRFALFHFDAFLVQAFHGVHFARVGLPAAVDFAKTATADDPVDAKVVHRQLRDEGKNKKKKTCRHKKCKRIPVERNCFYLNIQFEILPLAETRVLVAFDKLSKDVAS